MPEGFYLSIARLQASSLDLTQLLSQILFLCFSSPLFLVLFQSTFLPSRFNFRECKPLYLLSPCDWVRFGYQQACKRKLENHRSSENYFSLLNSCSFLEVRLGGPGGLRVLIPSSRLLLHSTQDYFLSLLFAVPSTQKNGA